MRFNRILRIIEFIVLFIPVTLLYFLALLLFIPVSLRDGDIPVITLGLILAAPCLISCYRFFVPVMLHDIGKLKSISIRWYIWIWIGCVLSLAALVSVIIEPLSAMKDDDFQHVIRMWAVGSVLIIPIAHIFIENKLSNTPNTYEP